MKRHFTSMFPLLSQATRRLEPERERKPGAATCPPGWGSRCPSPGTGWPSWSSQPSRHPLARAPRVPGGPDLHEPPANTRPLLGELASLSWRRGASSQVLGGRGPSAWLMASPVTQGPPVQGPGALLPTNAGVQGTRGPVSLHGPCQRGAQFPPPGKRLATKTCW